MKKLFFYILISFFFFGINIKKASASNDSIEISLLTCDAGDNIYTLFGHTAIRYQNFNKKSDFVFNYGIFDFSRPYFIWQFALGKTDYQLGVTSYANFVRQYNYFGRNITEQRLNLSTIEKIRLVNLLEENYKPENRIYRYSFLYDNCATKPRDKIEEAITDGTIVYPETPKDYSTTFRNIIHYYSHNAPWSKFGMDLCLGREADHPITRREMMFVPFYLEHFFKTAHIEYKDKRVPLVKKESKTDFEPNEPENNDFPLTPLQCSLILFSLTCIATIIGIKQRRHLWGVDFVLFLLAGLSGVVLFFLAVFSQHPAVHQNFNLLAFNPLQLIFLPNIIFSAIKNKRCFFHWLNIILLTLFIVIFLLKIQIINIAVVPLALSLYIRSISNIIVTYKK